MARNPAYHDAPHVLIEQIRAIAVNDTSLALAGYQAGELDRGQIPADEYPQLHQKFPGQAVSTPVSCAYAYLYNLSDKGPQALKDIRVRQALSLALDRQDVTAGLRGGQRRRPHGPIGRSKIFAAPMPPPAHPGQNEMTARARELLSEDGAEVA